MTPHEKVGNIFAESLRVLGATAVGYQADAVVNMARLIYESMANGGKLLICGNGGSSAQADHLAAEFLVRFKRERDPLPAISLNMDMATMTANANDLGYHQHFARMVRALGKPGDTFLGISTSGTSANVFWAKEEAKDIGIATGIATLGLFGKFGLGYDVAVHVPSDNTARIQEAHTVICHAIVELVEDMWLTST